MAAMRPRIQYARRPDGVRTAYVSMGSGPTLVMPPGGLTHLDWYLGGSAAQEAFCQRIAEVRTLVMYDRHGCGLSDRNRTDFTSEDDMMDIEAVVDATGATEIDLFGVSWGGTPCLTYAARYPDRVRRMILYGTFSQGGLGPGEEVEKRLAALRALRETDWDLYNKTQANRFFPSGAERETLESLARMLSDSTTPDMADQLEQVHADTQSLLADITTPSLVLHRRGDEVVPFVWGQYLARRISDCSFMPLDGDAHFPWVDADQVLSPTIEFLTGEAAAPQQAASHVQGDGMAVILFIDIANSTALTEELGDAAFREKQRGLDELLRTSISDVGGEAIEGKVLGDGVMAVFGSAREAIDCAQRCRTLGDTAGLPLHLGIHAGDVIREENNVHGGAVNIAARVADATDAGEILVSDIVRGLARTSAGVAFEDRGEHALKGIEEPQRLFAVKEQA